MGGSGTGPLVWAKDKEGGRYLCPLDGIADPNTVNDYEKQLCIDDDSRLASRRFVPANTPEGKVKFSKSFSMN